MIILDPLFRIVGIALDLYVWVIIIGAILSWLIAFNILNTSNQVVYTIVDFLYRITEPALRGEGCGHDNPRRRQSQCGGYCLARQIVARAKEQHFRPVRRGGAAKNPAHQGRCRCPEAAYRSQYGRGR